MISPDSATIDAAMRILREVGKQRGYDLVVYIRCDGRVQIDCENVAGYVKDKARGDLEEGTTPGEALVELSRRLAG
jgi:hypothetical protein